MLFGDGNGGFIATAPVPVGNGPREIESGDLDGDGDIDFITTNYSGNSVSVLLNNGSGTFTAAPAVPVGTVPRGVALGDLDGDGDLDFVSANYQSNTVSVMLNNGNGTLRGHRIARCDRDAAGGRCAGQFRRRLRSRHCRHQQHHQHRLDPPQ